MGEVGLDDVRSAHERVQRYVHRTPVVTSQYLDELSGRQLFFKAENLQKTGSFKARGACNCVLSILEQDPGVTGIVTHSSGNHGQATAYAARLAGLPCAVVVPRDTASVKIDAIRSYGAEVLLCDPTPVARREACARVVEQMNYAVAESSNSYSTIAGQGTIALEMLQQVPDMDAILVAVSGGGMIAGIATVVTELRPECKVLAVEPDGKQLEPCLRAGRPLWPDPPRMLRTLADGCRLQQCSPRAFAVIRRLVAPPVISVTDRQIAGATQLFWQRTKLI
ncbi:probable serine racemase [Pollicipes pollicipes]|nr:probable serine racemase [Pollicipes pollicipes]